MKRTSVLTLLVMALLGVGCGFAIDLVLTSLGRATFTPVVTLPILLVLLGCFVVALAVPVRRSVRDPRAPRVDPFWAVRTAALAKASSMVGAAVGGTAAGMLLFVATRPVVPALGSMATLLATLAAGGMLTAAAMVAESMCTAPKDPDEPDTDRPGPGTAAAG